MRFHDLKTCGLPISQWSRQHCWQSLYWKMFFLFHLDFVKSHLQQAGLKLCQTVVVIACVCRFFAIVVIRRHCFLCYTCLAQDEWEHFQYVLHRWWLCHCSWSVCNDEFHTSLTSRSLWQILCWKLQGRLQETQFYFDLTTSTCVSSSAGGC